MLRIIRNVSASYFVLILLAVVFVAPFIYYACKKDFALYNVLFFFIALAVGIFLCWLVSIISRTSLSKKLEHEKTFKAVLMGAFVLLLILEYVIVRGGFFKTGWDVSMLTNFVNPPELYYSQYPNQFFLAGLFRIIAQCGMACGLENGYLCVVLVGDICIAFSVTLISLVAKKVAGYKAGYCTLCMGFVFVGLSPWIFIPYSDSYGMICTTLILYSYSCVRNKPIKWGCISFVSVIGFFIKPTIVFATLSVLLIACVRQFDSDRANRAEFAQRKSEGLRACVSVIIAALLAIGISIPIRNLDMDIDENLAVGAPHYLMMGFNSQSMGVWNGEDLSFSMSFETPESRSSANLAEWMKRVQDAGPVGTASLLFKKCMTNFADGTFAWEDEGNFYVITEGDSEIVKSLYGIDESGSAIERDAHFAPIAQTLWFLLLFGAALCLLGRKPETVETIAFSALLMLGIFLMLFECRARYLFLYAPYFVFLGVLGWNRFGASIAAFRKVNRSAKPESDPSERKPKRRC